MVIKKAKVPHTFAFGLLKFILDLFEAVLTDSLTVEENDIIRISAENAGGRIFLKNDSLVVDKNFNRVFDVDVK